MAGRHEEQRSDPTGMSSGAKGGWRTSLAGLWWSGEAPSGTANPGFPSRTRKKGVTEKESGLRDSGRHCWATEQPSLAGLRGAGEQRAGRAAEAHAGEPGLHLEAPGQKSVLKAHEHCRCEGPQRGLLEAAFKARPPPSETYCQHLT